MENKTGIICIGHPLVESYAFIKASFLEKHNIPIGGTPKYSEEFINNLIKEVKFTQEYFGGSSCNVAKSLGMLGFKVALLGQYGNDKYGKIIENGLKENNIQNLCIVKPGGTTTRILICITPDAQRTMFGIFGASHEAHAHKPDYSKLKEYEAVLISGYQFRNDVQTNITNEILNIISENKQKLILAIADLFWLENYKTKMLQTLKQASITLGNKEEYEKLFDVKGTENIIKKLNNFNLELSVITLGPEGAIVIKNKEKIFINPPKVTKIIDTTSAGDYFASGILFGHFNKYSMDLTRKIANALAGNIISKMGSALDKEIIEQIKTWI